MLTLDQVNENNKVAKDILKELNFYLDTFKEEKKNEKLFLKNASIFRKGIFYFFKISDFLFNSKKCAEEMNIKMHLKFLKKDIIRYFKNHYTSAAKMSKIIAPKLEIKTYQDNILWTTITTHKIKNVPYPTK